MLFALDIAGTFVFAVAGGFRAVRHKLDVLGLMVLAVLTGVGGGLVRDALLGATPPASFQNELYLAVALAGGLAVVVVGRHIAAQWRAVQYADAVGLGVFTAIGAQKALLFGLGPIGAVMMGVLTAVGGGVIRDVLVREVPAVIQRDFYATASLIGGLALIGCHELGLGAEIQTAVAVVVTTGLRLYAMARQISLPTATSMAPGANEPSDE